MLGAANPDLNPVLPDNYADSVTGTRDSGLETQVAAHNTVPSPPVEPVPGAKARKQVGVRADDLAVRVLNRVPFGQIHATNLILSYEPSFAQACEGLAG